MIKNLFSLLIGTETDQDQSSCHSGSIGENFMEDMLLGCVLKNTCNCVLLSEGMV